MYPMARPSEMLAIDDAYTAYCFDEAIAYISTRLQNGDDIIIRKHYSKPSELYKQYQK